MNNSTLHPLRATADALTRALLVSGSRILDDGRSSEIDSTDWKIEPFHLPSDSAFKPVVLQGGRYSMRTSLLASRFAELAAFLPGKVFAIGNAYNAADGVHPCHLRIEGVIAEAGFGIHEAEQYWTYVAQETFGLGCTCKAVAQAEDVYEIQLNSGEGSFTLAFIGEATLPAKTLMGLAAFDKKVWAYVIDVDNLTMARGGFTTRDELYSPSEQVISATHSNQPSFGSDNYAKAVNVLRQMGFSEFFGQKVYEADCYKKMNMIQDEWDANNKGVLLAEPLGERVGMPTVLTPALEEALAAKYKAGEQSARIFEIGHIFLPKKKGDKRPVEKISLSFGAYGDELDKASWKKLVDEFLTDLGIQNHFFIPTDMAIAYNTSACWVIMDQNMRYLEGNFGEISPKARTNHGIGVPAYMAQLEFAPLSSKMDEELAFEPTEYL